MKYDLDRFKKAQEACYPQVLREMRNGRKESHWMWFIFPQIAGLGRSDTAKKYAIQNLEEAKQYLSDETLCSRLLELTNILAHDIIGKAVEQIFGYPDYLKLHSSMTLFNRVVESVPQLQNDSRYNCFKEVLQKYFNGKLDQSTLHLL